MSLTPDLKERIQGIVDSAPVVLFMKGSPEQPQCGFSQRVTQVLQRVIPEFASFDVLSDMEVREGVKEFSDWPTIPQLYIGGEFQGGCDIVAEMYDNGELHTALGLEVPSVDAVPLTITDDAAEILRDAQEQQSTDLHLGIDALFQPSLGLGPAVGTEIQATSNGITLHLDRDSAVRAQGLVIDAKDTGNGKFLAIDNPNAPAPSPAAD